ncbi:MAG: hypothetical protein D6747_07840 [Chlorobiota bacterium]|nr:MAG: hypothetical protein D6747_07840 [Chlorobiota bacterium]
MMLLGRWLCVAALFAGLATAQTLTPFDFLRSAENSARAAGLGGAFVAYAGDASAQLFNPATIPTTVDNSLSVTFTKHVLDINSGVAAYTRRLGSGWMGASAAVTSFGTFTRTDGLGNTIGTFGAAGVSLALSYANQFDTNAYYGITIGYVQTTIDRAAASALMASVGLLYQLPKIRTAIGASVRYIGFQLARMNGQDASLPTDVRIGVSHRLRGLPLLVNFNLARLAEERMSFAERIRNFTLGGELTIGTALQIRVGYDNGIRSSQSSATASFLTGMGIGAGLLFPGFTLDYTLTTLSAPAAVHRISCGVALDRLLAGQ